MKRRCTFQTGLVSQRLQRVLVAFFFFCFAADVAFADGSGSLESFTGPLRNGLNLIMVFGFIAGCVMVMSGFLNAKRDENWKMTVIYGIGVAGAVALMKALFAMFGDPPWDYTRKRATTILPNMAGMDLGNLPCI
jgi:hypothetical protein